MFEPKLIICNVCGCKSIAKHPRGKYCQKCKLIFGQFRCSKICRQKRSNPFLNIQKIYETVLSGLSSSARIRISNTLGRIPARFDEDSALDIDLIELGKARLREKSLPSKSSADEHKTEPRRCSCCGEEFVNFGPQTTHCSVCTSVFHNGRLKTISKMPDSYKCELYRIYRSQSSPEVQSITPEELHGKLSPELDIRIHPTVAVLDRIKDIKLHELLNKQSKSTKVCCRCGIEFEEGGDELVSTEKGAEKTLYRCERCVAYDKEHETGTKFRHIPGLSDMTYEHIALLPSYAACAYTKHMTDAELRKYRQIRDKVRQPHDH